MGRLKNQIDKMRLFSGLTIFVAASSALQLTRARREEEPVPEPIYHEPVYEKVYAIERTMGSMDDSEERGKRPTKEDKPAKNDKRDKKNAEKEDKKKGKKAEKDQKKKDRENKKDKKKADKKDKDEKKNKKKEDKKVKKDKNQKDK